LQHDDAKMIGLSVFEDRADREWLSGVHGQGTGDQEQQGQDDGSKNT
jgi:hypothetical protein